jgi:hypothetical protein
LIGTQGLDAPSLRPEFVTVFGDQCAGNLVEELDALGDVRQGIVLMVLILDHEDRP